LQSQRVEETAMQLHSLAPIVPSSPFAGRMLECADACVALELTCVAYADACLRDKEPGALRRCILSLDCAAAAAATAHLFTRGQHRGADVVRAHLEACMSACATCAAECPEEDDASPEAERCRQMCRSCRLECERLLGELTADLAA
jgi:hypothetical protein